MPRGLVVMWLAIGSEFPGSNPGYSGNLFFFEILKFFEFLIFKLIYLVKPRFDVSISKLGTKRYQTVSILAKTISIGEKLKKNNNDLPQVRLELAIYCLDVRRANHYTTRNSTVWVDKFCKILNLKYDLFIWADSAHTR